MSLLEQEGVMTGSDQYYLNLATQIGQENGTCNRLRAGTVIVRRGESEAIIAVGFNTTPDGMPTCDSSDHLMQNGHCIATLHSETVAIGLAAKNGVSVKGCIAFVSHTPCLYCAKLLIAAGISKILYLKDYANAEHKEALSIFSKFTGIPINHFV